MPPNIVLIVMDAASANHISCYGYDRPTTPNIDAIAKEGYQYRNAITNSLFTLPTHASLCSGQYPHEHKCVNFWLDTMDNNLTSGLKERGYHTMAFPGINHGFQKGFDSYSSDPLGGRYTVFGGTDLFSILSDNCGSGRTFDGSLPRWRCYLETMVRNIGPRPYVNGLYHYYVKKVKDRILLNWDDFGTQAHMESAKDAIRQTDTSAFIYINSVEPHYPYLPKRHAEKFLPANTSRSDIRGALNKGLLDLTLDLGAGISDKEREILVSLYDAELRYLDELIGEFYEFLQDESRLQDTVLILTADHGESIGTSGIFGHRAGMIDEILKIPMVVKYTDSGPTGVEDDYVELKDLFHHILSLATGDLTPISGKKQAFAEYFGLDTQHKNLFKRQGLDKGYWSRYQAALYRDGSKFVWDSLCNEWGDDSLKPYIQDIIGSPRAQSERYRIRKAAQSIPFDTI